MKKQMVLAAFGILAAVLSVPAVSQGEQATSPAPSTQTIPAFPPSTNCSAQRPCQNVTGEIVRIEESYWIKDMNGHEVHMRVTPDTRLDTLPRVGDKVSAQVRSDGNAEALVKVPSPQQPQIQVPSKNLKDFR